MTGVRSSGARLREALDELGLRPRRFARVLAGLPLQGAAPAGANGQPASEEFRRFESKRRQLTRWLKDEHAISDENARELVEALNRLRRTQGLPRLPADHLVTESRDRARHLGELEAKLDEALARIERLEERIP